MPMLCNSPAVSRVYVCVIASAYLHTYMSTLVYTHIPAHVTIHDCARSRVFVHAHTPSSRKSQTLRAHKHAHLCCSDSGTPWHTMHTIRAHTSMHALGGGTAKRAPYPWKDPAWKPPWYTAASSGGRPWYSAASSGGRPSAGELLHTPSPHRMPSLQSPT
jgi:hypothetical protein